MTFDEILDQAQSFLHDDGGVWPRTELLRWAMDGYRALVYSSGCTTRPYQTDVPGRTCASFSQTWEEDAVPGIARVFARVVGNHKSRVAFLWEVEFFEGATPSNSYEVVTQLWEQAYSGDLDAHFRFALPRQTDRPLKVYWDSKRLAHTSVREMDQSYDRWWRDTGEPIATLPGVGPEKSLEVYLLKTDYVQSYNLVSFETGLPRQFSSDSSRSYVVNSPVQTWNYSYTSNADSGMVAGTGVNIALYAVDASTGTRSIYSWEVDTTTASDDAVGILDTMPDAFSTDFVQLGVGQSRHLTSADREYLGVSYDSGQDLLGIPRRFASSDNALTVWMDIIPDRPLIESDTPGLLPSQLHKYIKFYTLAQAFARTGQGYRPDLAQHYLALYQLGVSLLAVLGTPSVLDRVYAREQVRDASIQAPPRVRLPATFPVEGRFL